MKKLFMLFIGIMLMAGMAQAQDRGTPAEAKAMVKKAAAYVKEVGRDKALAEFNNPKGKFIYKDLYIYANTSEDAVTLAHPYTPALVGKSMMNLKDADGRYFIKEKNEIGKQYGGGEISYRWSHPQTKKVEMKFVYFEIVDDLTINCGYYK